MLEPRSAAAAKSLQSCPTLCNPIDGSPPGSPVPGILQARTLEWVAISFFSGWKWKVKGKSLIRIGRLAPLKVMGWVSTIVGATSFLVHVQGMTENWFLTAFRELRNFFPKPQKVSSQISLAPVKPHYYFWTRHGFKGGKMILIG